MLESSPSDNASPKNPATDDSDDQLGCLLTANSSEPGFMRFNDLWGDGFFVFVVRIADYADYTDCADFGIFGVFIGKLFV